MEHRRGNQSPEEAPASWGCFSLNCLISWLEVYINSSSVFVIWQDAKQNDSWQGRGWGLDRGRVTLTAIGTKGRSGKESAVGQRRAPNGGICFLSWQRPPAVGCTEGQGGVGIPWAQGLCSKARPWLYHGKPHFTSPQFILGAAIWSHKTFLGCAQSPAATTVLWIDCHVVIVCNEFYML